MLELYLLIGIALCVMLCGVIPVISQHRAETQQSPWAYPVEQSVLQTNSVDISQFTPAATHSSVNVDIPSIPEFMPETFNTIKDSPEVSEPSEESWNNVSLLLNETMNTPVAEEPFEVIHMEAFEDIRMESEEEHLPLISSLSQEQYDAVRLQFGEKVSKIVTCTPFQGSLGPQIMIGQFFKEERKLVFDSDWVILANGIEENLDGEFILVKGNFLNDGTFFVQHWEDPEMVEEGYSSYFEDYLYQKAN